MTRVAIILLVILLLVPVAVDAKFYRQYNHKLEFSIPDNWQSLDQPNNEFLVYIVAPELQNEINILTLFHQQIPERYTLTDYVNNTVVNQSKLLWQYRLQNKQLVEHSFGPYYRLTFTWSLSWEQQYFVQQMLICRYPDVYVLTATAPLERREEYEPVFLRVFESFAFFN